MAQVPGMCATQCFIEHFIPIGRKILFPTVATNRWSLAEMRKALRAAAVARELNTGGMRAFPFRLLRYWFAANALRDESTARGEPLRVLEVGVGRGAMKAYVDAVRGSALPYGSWDAVTLVRRPELGPLGYGRVGECDIERHEDARRVIQGFSDGRTYDVILLVHVLEHLRAPHAAARMLAGFLSRRGVMIGGFPVTPEWARERWEARLRARAKWPGHVSVFSPQRVGRMARECGLDVDWLNGAFFARATGSPLEDREWWARFNLGFGRCWPSWPGECYWKLRVPKDAPA